MVGASVVSILTGVLLLQSNQQEPSVELLPELRTYVNSRIGEFDRISEARREQLAPLTAYVRKCAQERRPVRLVFVCTHNSRRSQLSQLWARVAAEHYGLAGVETYSGGTESTAFNPRAVAAARRAGFAIEATTRDDNPVYHVRFASAAPALTCFSKVYNQAPNPRQEFAAIMVCTQADEACPAVSGAAARISLPYEDPKASDGTPAEAATYDERCAQIARELLFVFAAARG